MPDAAVVLDTSGSMSSDLLARALVEIKGILRAVGQRKVPVLCCDAAVHGGVQRVSSAFNVEITGGGGTDMGVGIEAAQKLRASVIIVLTDGYTPWPAEPPKGAQLVIGILNPTTPWEKSYPTPSYAKRVLRIAEPKARGKAA
jgi:predicted metal-dependent peptidase